MKLNQLKSGLKGLFAVAAAAFGLSVGAAELPEDYTVVDYIVAPAGSYIDTGYEPSHNTRVAMDVTVQGAREYWFGAWNIDWDNGAYALGNDNGEVYCGYGSGRTTCGGIKVDDKGLPNGRVTVALEKGVVYTNGVVWSNAHSSGAQFTVNYNLYLFAQNRKGTATPGDGQGDIICHGCTISEGSVVKRDFVPCVRVSDQAFGLYDLAESDPGKAFYANAGKGAFGVPEGIAWTVTVGAFSNMTAAYTFGDGSVTNAISGTSFAVLKGTSGVKVIFTAKRNFELKGESVVELGPVTEDVVFGDGNDYAVPSAVCVFGDISYLDWDEANGKMTNATIAVTDYEPVTSETRTFADGKWYVVADDVAINDGGNITVSGSAHLILCDGASLTVNKVGKDKAAIGVSATGSTTNSLTIYGQENGSGSLTATGHFGAGIGGGNYGAGGTVTINGGTVTATGDTYGAGLGGGYEGAGGTVRINGGTVTARGGNNGAGIGGGDYGAGGTVTINGGTVTATGGNNGAGIGGGNKGAGGSVKINGGAVEAIAREGASVMGHGFEGVGDGFISISGGIFGMAVDQRWCAPGCGVFPNTDPETQELYPWTVQGGAATVTVGEFKNMTAAWTSGDGSVTNAISGTSFAVLKGTSGVKVIFTAKKNYAIEGESVVELEGIVTENVVFGDGNDYAVPSAVCVFGDISYLDWDEANGTMTNAMIAVADYELVSSETRTFADGKWYVVADDVAINDGGNITVSGSAHLILCDDASLTVVDVGNLKAAIDVSASGSTTNSLTIYGQENGLGSLTATGHFGAGIGGGYYGAVGVVTINGGTVTAAGGEYAAGIGGGNAGAGGTVRINGGAVTATGGNAGAGIGGGLGGAVGTVRINGGTVTATGGEWAAGIGGGEWAAGGTTIAIIGGTVTATGGEYAAGIGGGWHGAGCAVTINGGAVKAIAGEEASVIGCGKDGDKDGFVSISGGIFGMEIADGWCAEGHAVRDNPDPASAKDYPWTVVELFVTVTLEGRPEHATVAYTFGDGSVTNAIEGTDFVVKWGTENVKVIFTAESKYQFADGSKVCVHDLPSPLCEGEVITPPEAEGIPGTDVAPWSVGDDVTAYVSDESALVIGGTGAMYDFASAADVPWAAVAKDLSAVTVEDGVTYVGKNAFVGIADTVKVNGTALSVYDMMAGARGFSEGGASPVDEIRGFVTADGFSAIKIEDGMAKLDVVVGRSDSLGASAEWTPVSTNTVEVPAPGEQGFFIVSPLFYIPGTDYTITGGVEDPFQHRHTR